MPTRPADTAPASQPAEEPEVTFTAAPALEDAVNEAASQETDVATKATKKAPDEGAHEVDTTRYKVLSGGISAPSGRPVVTFWKGDIVTGEEIGGADRVAKLLARHAIEAVKE